jgi:Cu-Zn family superoxide dismutase
VSAQEPTATATLIDPDGNEVGRAELVQTPNRGVLIRIAVDGLEPGVHGFHIHETGQCDAPDFGSAGGHYAPGGHAHGVLHDGGSHAGDLLNLVVPQSGRLDAERLATAVVLLPGAQASLMDDDGSALVIHANADDYISQPSGGGGPKVACGVIR